MTRIKSKWQEDAGLWCKCVRKSILWVCQVKDVGYKTPASKKSVYFSFISVGKDPVDQIRSIKRRN